jgi:hypothetical protein
MTTKLKFFSAVAVLAILVSLPVAFGNNAEAVGFKTSKTSYVDLVDPINDSIMPILTTGDIVGPYTFDQIPDGIGMVSSKKMWDDDKHGNVIAYINHEIDGGGSKVSKVTLNKDGEVIDAKMVIGADGLGGTPSGYSRFCSSSMASDGAFKKNPYYLTNEEVDAGKVVLINTKTDAVTPLDDLGLFAHEQTINIPKFWDTAKKVVMLLPEDGPAGQSELYMHVADSVADLLAGNGKLYVWTAGTTNNDWRDFPAIGGGSLSGTFVELPDTWKTPTSQPTADKQLAADAHDIGAMQFIRLEDATVDKRTNKDNIVYIADTGEVNPAPDGVVIPTTDFNHGRIYKLTFTDKNDPTKAKMEVILDGNAAGNPGSALDVKGRPMMSNPDNMDTSKNSLMIQEDRISSTRINSGSPGYDASDPRNNAKILRYDLDTGTLEVIAYMNQLYTAGLRHGDTESSGIHDASEWYGKGTWLFDVQGHGPWEAAKIDGQLSLLTVKGS